MTEKRKKYPIQCILIIYLICFVFRGIEYLLIRTDQTIIGEAFIHKLAGIAVLIASVRFLVYKWHEIGFNSKTAVRYTLLGLLMGGVTFFIAYLTEYLVQSSAGGAPELRFFVSSYSLAGNQAMNSGILFILICIAGNIINVVMEEGIFRGLFIRLGEEKFSYTKAMLIASFCFGFWHIAQSVRGLLDGTMTPSQALISALGYIVLTVVMGIKFALLVKITGSLWMPMADHFVNNTIVNLLHIVTATGTDEMQFIRLSTAHTISFIFVVILFIKSKAYNKLTFR